MQRQFHQAFKNSLIPLFMQLRPLIKLHHPSPPPDTPSECARSLRWVSRSLGKMAEVTRHEGARNPELHLRAAAIAAKPRCFHGSEQGPDM